MAQETSDAGSPTLRECVECGGAVISGGLFAGCAAGAGSEPAPKSGGGETTTTTEDETTPADGPCSVSGEPMGEVAFESGPEQWMAEDERLFDYQRAADTGNGDF